MTCKRSLIRIQYSPPNKERTVTRLSVLFWENYIIYRGIGCVKIQVCLDSAQIAASTVPITLVFIFDVTCFFELLLSVWFVPLTVTIVYQTDYDKTGTILSRVLNVY